MINYLINFTDEDRIYQMNLNLPKLITWRNTKTDRMVSIHIFNFFTLDQQLFRSVRLAYIEKDIHSIHKKISTYLIDDNFNINDQQISIEIYCLQQLPFLINSNFAFLFRSIKQSSYVNTASLVLYFCKDILQHTYVHCQENRIYDVYNHLGQTENADDIKSMLLIWYKKMNKIINPYLILNNIK